MSSVDPNKIHNIIFDLGGVILNIDYNKTELAFVNLGITNFNELYSQFHANSFFKDFEKGKISEESFIRQLKSYAPHLSEHEIITAWNAMLLDFPKGRIAFLLKLKMRYRTFLLSNTNVVHHQAFQKIELETAGTLDACFEKVYYSHELGLRKPDNEIFEFVLKDSNLKAEETLFIDDTLPNVKAALFLNLNAIYIESHQRIENLLADLIN